MKNKYNTAVSLMYLCFTFLFTVKAFKVSGAVWGEIIICTLFQYCMIELIIYIFDGKKYRIKYLIYCLAVLMLGCFMFRKKLYGVLLSIEDSFIDCLNNFVTAINTNSPVVYNKITLLIIGVVIILTTIIYFLVSKKLEMIVSLLLCVLMGIMYRVGYKKNVISFTMVFITLNLAVIALKNNFKTNILRNSGRKIISIAIVIFITCCITNIIPKDYSGIENITSSGIIFGNEKKVIGYDDLAKKLGGSLEPNSDTAFEYSFPFGVSDGVTYFRGQTYDVYDGRSWTKSKHQNVIDSKDYKDKFKNIDKKYVDYVDIYPKNLRVNTFLAPEQSYYIKKNNNSSSNIDEYNKVFDNGSKVSESYKVEFIDKSITKNLKEGGANTTGITDVESSEYKNSIKDYEDFVREYDELNSSEAVDKHYLSLPNSIPDKVKKDINEDIAERETQTESGVISDYEKVTEIYGYICNRCKYDLNASNLPKGQDFVDFFLNKDKKGYCMHFATACVILCRMEGIPARLVTGFKETMTGKKPNEKYSVTNNQAHAWCEVFMKDNTASSIDKHWITVDPTPDKDGICEGIEAVKVSSENSNAINKAATNEVTYSAKNYHSETDFDEKHSRAKQILDEEENVSSDTNTKVNKKLFIPIAIILVFIMIRICIIILKYKIMKKKCSSIKFVSAVMTFLSFAGYKKKKMETELEFAGRIEDYYLRSDVIRLIKLSNAEYYGNKHKTSESYLLFLNIKHQIKSKLGFEFYIKEFFWL